MALIKCNDCGRTISDRAKTCPHCGHTQEDDTCAENKVEEQANLISPKESIEEEAIEEEEDTTPVNKVLVAFVVVLAIVAISFGCYIYYGGRNQNDVNIGIIPDTLATDSLSADTIMSSTIEANPTNNDSVSADTATASSNNYKDNEQIKEEIGFKSNSDVMDFVVGNSYSHDGITLRITDEAIYANDNKISTSNPTFRKISLNKGVITARPSISITVIREDNRLVDNNNGDTYYY